MKCITYNCPNCSDDQGAPNGRTICVEPEEDGWICEACWTFLTESTGRLNQIYRNAKEVLRQRQSDQAHYYAGQAAAQYPKPASENWTGI